MGGSATRSRTRRGVVGKKAFRIWQRHSLVGARTLPADNAFAKPRLRLRALAGAAICEIRRYPRLPEHHSFRTVDAGVAAAAVRSAGSEASHHPGRASTRE